MTFIASGHSLTVQPLSPPVHLHHSAAAHNPLQKGPCPPASELSCLSIFVPLNTPLSSHCISGHLKKGVFCLSGATTSQVLGNGCSGLSRPLEGSVMLSVFHLWASGLGPHLCIEHTFSRLAAAHRGSCGARSLQTCWLQPMGMPQHSTLFHCSLMMAGKGLEYSMLAILSLASVGSNTWDARCSTGF